jgi:Glycosyl transferases group 1/Glycosyltransferase Family 4
MFAGLAGTPAIIDGLALPDLETVVAAHRDRLRLIALVHHPVAEETGLSRAEAWRAARLEAAILPQCHGVICPSRKTAAAVERYGVSPERIAVVQPGTEKPAAHRRTRRGRCWPASGPRHRSQDIFVLPSFHEGYGMAYAEAMAHGLPIIVTTAGAKPDTVPRSAGLLVPPGDPISLARVLRRMLVWPAFAARLAAGSRAAGARLPDWRRATEQWEKALERFSRFRRLP